MTTLYHNNIIIPGNLVGSPNHLCKNVDGFKFGSLVSDCCITYMHKKYWLKFFNLADVKANHDTTKFPVNTVVTSGHALLGPPVRVFVL